MALKLCPSCRSEYVRTALRCADCGAALVFADEFAPPPEEAAGAELPPASELSLVRSGSASDLDAFAELLQELGISSRIDSYPPGKRIDASATGARSRGAGAGSRLGLYVLEADLADAASAIEERMLSELPDAVRVERGELSACPACSAPIAADAIACSDCGLEFPGQERICSECGGTARAEDLSCPSCNAPLGR